MNRVGAWLKEPLGKALKRLHAWNGWLVLLLACTGLLLYWPWLRGDLAGLNVRVGLKQLHVILGLLSAVVLVLYLPRVRKHLKQLRGPAKRGQRWNLGLVLTLLAGWIGSGAVLWLQRDMPQELSNAMLIVHDLLTWLGVPWLLYHSLSRSRWLRREAGGVHARQSGRQGPAQQPAGGAASGGPPGLLSAADREAGPGEAGQSPSDSPTASERPAERLPAGSGPFYTRRRFLRGAIGAGLLLAVGPYFYRWVKQLGDTGGELLEQYAASDQNRMLPSPQPLPDSLPPVGGGIDGRFRVYTVTEMPVFHSDDWEFQVDGLVEQRLRLTWGQLLALPRVVQVSDFYCVTGWTVFQCTWEGIPLSTLLAAAGVKRSAGYVKFYSGDGVYTDALSLDQAQLDDVLVAVLLDGRPLPQQLGGPVRLIVPRMYAYKSVKWLQRIELIDTPHNGYWQVRGYDVDAWVPGKKPTEWQ
ncbi:molybdopterin-dependent oxidoreductase [Paenibacillus sp. y28]|uniref:molybdopterin-dependent oxidoreductase n=1 Tax=Paenibacillus sp. y28 TaxID=3129110 RepID=UPI0030186421